MKTIILISLGLCLLVSISAEKSSHKHAGKLLKSGHELKESNINLDDAATAPKSPLPVQEESPAVKPVAGREGGRKHHRHGKNKKGGAAGHHQQEQHQQQQQAGCARKSHSKPKVNNNGPSKTQSKQGRKHGRGKQTQ